MGSKGVVQTVAAYLSDGFGAFRETAAGGSLLQGVNVIRRALVQSLGIFILVFLFIPIVLLVAVMALPLIAMFAIFVFFFLVQWVENFPLPPIFSAIETVVYYVRPIIDLAQPIVAQYYRWVNKGAAFDFVANAYLVLLFSVCIISAFQQTTSKSREKIEAFAYGSESQPRDVLESAGKEVLRLLSAATERAIILLMFSLLTFAVSMYLLQTAGLPVFKEPAMSLLDVCAFTLDKALKGSLFAIFNFWDASLTKLEPNFQFLPIAAYYVLFRMVVGLGPLALVGKYAPLFYKVIGRIRRLRRGSVA